jgi:hypothetical protein
LHLGSGRDNAWVFPLRYIQTLCAVGFDPYYSGRWHRRTVAQNSISSVAATEPFGTVALLRREIQRV